MIADEYAVLERCEVGGIDAPRVTKPASLNVLKRLQGETEKGRLLIGRASK